MSNMIDSREALTPLLHAAMLLSPSGYQQQGFSNLVNDMRRANETERAIVTAVVAALHDGLQHGNWPKAPT